jgi:hypothetical protein
MTIPDARVADDSDAQRAFLERERVSVSPVSRRYWQAIDPAQREAIVEAIPPGYRLVIKPGYRSTPGTCDVELRDDRGSAAGPAQRGYLTASLCWRALPHIHFHAHGGSRHSHVHVHPEDHAHSARSDAPAHEEEAA